MKHFLSFGFILVISFACDPAPDTSLKIQNNSLLPVFFMTSLSYPDTINFTISGCTSSTKDPSYLRPYEINGVPTGPGGNWENIIKRVPSRTIMFFVYNADTVSKYVTNIAGMAGCDSLAKRKDLILKRFDVTVDYLNKNNWTLTYP